MSPQTIWVLRIISKAVGTLTEVGLHPPRFVLEIPRTITCASVQIVGALAITLSVTFDIEVPLTKWTDIGKSRRGGTQPR